MSLWPAEAIVRQRAFRLLRAAVVVCGLVAGLLGAAAVARAADVVRIPIAYLGQAVEPPPSLSNLEPPPADEGIDGGRLAIDDNNTTGKFLNQSFSFDAVHVPIGDDAVAAFKRLLDQGQRLVILNVPADVLLKIADVAKGKGVLLFNAGAADDRLRNADCRDDVFHIAPSRAMLADALAQYLAWKRWTKWLLVVGRRPGDKLFADAIKRAAKRFGGRIMAEKSWTFGPDVRRTAQAEMPKFTQGVDYDVLIVADESGEFGEYLAYRTWLPRPIAGTQGLVPTTWHWTHEQWGAVQLQNRFRDTFHRAMTALDYQVWAAVRAVGEAATRTNSGDAATIQTYIRGPRFELAGFKGQKLTFRTWDHQLRQPILLAAPRALVSSSPQKGFLHPTSLLDTLGYDAPETTCKLH